MNWLGVFDWLTPTNIAWLESLVPFDPEVRQFVFDVCEAR